MDFTDSQLMELVCRWIGPSKEFLFPAGKPRTITDTTDFFRVEYNDILVLEGRPFLIRNNEKEGRFGIDEQPKFWVKRAIDLLDGSVKIIKLVFHEHFKARAGPLTFECVRSPLKEARVIALASSHPNLMHGFSARDSRGNLVRVVDYIFGRKLEEHIAATDKKTHIEYFHSSFPQILREFIESAGAIKFLHDNREIHGDIRRDHLIKDRDTGRLRWIDFDFTYDHPENRFGYDIFGLGNVLIFIAGGGDITIQRLRAENPEAFSRLSPGDVNIIFGNRVANLGKLFPYMPEAMNRVLLHFSAGTDVFYEETGHFLDDLVEAENSLRGA
ncbi:MAG: hypothetical protein M0Z59_06385 [Nitrospiraceae bacterium]|nr:hypothetical protein [Nitrospiraceae bacterium]